MNYLPFGDDNAEDDTLLIPCAFDKKDPEEERYILLGRWGVGKTGTLLLQNQKQNEKLKQIDKRLDRIWYINEHGLDIVSLFKLKEKYVDSQTFVKAVEKIWKIEITRIYALLLYNLKSEFGNFDSEHWKYLSKAVKDNNSFFRAIWKNAAKIIDVFTSGEDENSLQAIGEDIRAVASEKLFENVKLCLDDITDRQKIPMVVVEPIETPTSEVEQDEGIAHSLIQALLNCWHAHFKPNKGRFKVKISIPWHRDITDDLDFPQKVFQHKTFVEWNKVQLKGFIEKRIEFEFNRVQKYRHIIRDTPNLWYELFEEKIINGFCGYEEDSFDYFVRHTHFRPRDLLRLVRHCVVLHAKLESLSIDEAIKKQIPANTVKQAFHTINPEVTKQLIVEGERRYPGIKTICTNFTGLPLPFTIEQLRKRIKEVSEIPFSDAAKYLWDTGIIGVVAMPNSLACSNKMEVHFNSNARKAYTDVTTTTSKDNTTTTNKKEHVWTWFEYNYNGSVLDLMEKLTVYDCSKNFLVFHPKTYELFLPRHDKDFCYPIG